MHPCARTHASLAERCLRHDFDGRGPSNSSTAIEELEREKEGNNHAFHSFKIFNVVRENFKISNFFFAGGVEGAYPTVSRQRAPLFSPGVM